VDYASLFALAPADLRQHDHTAIQSHMTGMFTAYTATTALVLFAVARIRSAQARAEFLFLQAHDLKARSIRLSSLATLAAGTAHELATPLSTITVVIRELGRRTENRRDPVDIALIREELQRCHAVLCGLSADVGMGMGASPSTLSAQELVTDAFDHDEAKVSVGPGTVCLPVDLVQQMLRRLVENAHDAGPTHVTVHGDVEDNLLRLQSVFNTSRSPSSPPKNTTPDSDCTSSTPSRGSSEDAEHRRAEWEHIQRVPDDYKGNVTKAPQKLGLHRRTLQRKLQIWPPNR
jgi:hypothetical protein